VIPLSVNLNKIALLRNSRGGTRPDILDAARTAIRAGAYGITVHPRPDQRHIRPSDVHDLVELLRGEFPGIELNVEGNPLTGATDGGYPGYVALLQAVRPDQATLVPDGDDQRTSDHGWNLARDAERVEPLVRELKSFGCRVSLFMDPEPALIDRVPATGADRIELYTGPFAEAFAHDGHAGGRRARASLARFTEAARHAQRLDIGVNAGHDLDLDNLVAFRTIAGVLEVSIGHALLADALDMGLYGAVRRYLDVLRYTPGPDSGF